jgi:multidrug resistance efflux pump
MKKNILLLLTPVFLFAQTYMTKVEPYEQLTIYAQSSGQIVKLDKADETKTVSKMLIKIDDSLEKMQLKLYENQLNLYLEKLKILQNSYNRYIKIKGKSQADKEDKYYELINLKITIDSLKLSINELKNTIKKKSIYVNDLYIKEFLVNNGDYISAGTKLATAFNLTKSKLIVYISKDDYKDIKDKRVLINKKENIATIEKIDKTIDDTYVSAHKVTLVLDNKNFGEVMQVEFVK